MIVYRFDRLFKARGIERPFTFLQQAGFSMNFASKIKNNRVSRLNMKQMEKLCLLLKCTPNDMMAWIPDKNAPYDDDVPLAALRMSETEIDMVKTINSIPLGKLERIEQLIREELKKQ